ncbi:type III secretion system chaperone [Acanthopleuribacter pedis]|uniref:Type III secretion system chaperone n=1 Tax=Acanthopleuribacter pedis TaxID=442870 RepID=A0A8J7U251_9BACT|nr:type III secretion system chaperone [Acanthopleuribacter pedis]MBO1318242.1 type III secretion system chaperone [Acanthopleuribacter pedis]
MSTQSWLHQLSTDIGTFTFQRNQNGVCAFDIEDTTIVLETPESENAIILYAPLTPLTEIADDAAYRRILALNFLCRDTAGATLAVNERAATVCLCAHQNPDLLDYPAFKAWIIQFVDTAVWLQKEIPARIKEATPNQPPTPEPTLHQHATFA